MVSSGVGVSLLTLIPNSNKKSQNVTNTKDCLQLFVLEQSDKIENNNYYFDPDNSHDKFAMWSSFYNEGGTNVFIHISLT